MSKHIQIRNVPEDLHGKLESRAALEGLSLSDYLLRELRDLAEYPTLAEFRSLLEAQEPVDLPPGVGVVDLIREDREVR